MTITTPAAPTHTLHRSILSVQLTHPAIQAAMADAHNMHRLIMTGWAHHTETKDFFDNITGAHPDHRQSLGILYAVSGRRPDGTLRIITQAHQPPRWTNDVSNYWTGALTTDPHTAQRTTEQAGTAIDFELRARPVTTVRGRKLAIRDDAKLQGWLHRKATDAGLQLRGQPLVSQPWTMESAIKTARTKSAQTRTGPGGFVQETIRFQGTATISDSSAYQAALADGIGPGKPYGCGLLLTKPAHH